MRLKLRFLESGPQGDAVQVLAESAQMSAPNAEGTVWKVAVLAFGKSKRAPHYVYTREAAQRSIERFEGARVYANSSADDYGHKSANLKVPRDTVGVLSNVTVTESELQADLHVLPSAGWLRENLLYAQSKKLPIPYELSIDATGFAKPGQHNGEQLPIVESFDRVSVDVVERGAAGGKILRMVASDNKSKGEFTMNAKQKLLALFALLYPAFLESKKVDLAAVDENQLFTYLLEADKPQSRMHLPDGAQFTEALVDETWKKVRESIGKAPDPPAKKVEQKIELDTEALADIKKLREGMDEGLKAIQLERCGLLLQAKLTESKLPMPWQEHVRSIYAGRAFETKDLEATIKSVRETHAKFVESAVKSGGLDIRAGMDSREKIVKGLEGFFMLDPNRPNPGSDQKELAAEFKDVPRFRSFREAYAQFTGDVDVTGRADKASRLTESLQTTDWANVLAATLNRRMVRDYGMLNLDTWREFTDIVPVSNFKQQERVRYGGYGNLPTVSQGAPYAGLTSPTDEKATYTPTKKGGTEDITREMILNDDVGSISRIPQRMARAAAQTLHEFVFNFVNPAVNANIYTGTALYLAGQSNIGSAALASDGVALAAARLRMKKFAMKDNSKRLGVRARYLLVPSDLESIAYGLVTAAAGVYNNVPTFLQRQAIVPIVVDYWTDTTDWALAADRADVVGLEVGFINGQETPELFVSDVPNVGSMFTNDKITYKIRHEYGGAVIDWRAFDGSIVT